MNLKRHIKNFLVDRLSYLKYALFGRALNMREAGGTLDKFTNYKLMPYTAVEVPFCLGRTFRGVSFSSASNEDPFWNFCKGCSLGELDESLVGYLLDLYRKEALQSAADVVGLAGSRILKSYPAWTAVLPWERESLEDRRLHYFRSFIGNRAEYESGFYAMKHLNEKNLGKALYSEMSARSQVRQTKKLWRSINEHGVLPTHPLPSILIMRSGSMWRWFMSSSGNHRAYLSHIYGCRSFYARVQSFVNREDMKKWPNVANGTYTSVEALRIFDSIFDGVSCRRGVI